MSETLIPLAYREITSFSIETTAFMFGYGYRLKLAVTVTWNGNDRFSMFGPDFLRITAIPRVVGVISCHRILFIPQIGIHFAFKHFSNTWACNCFRNLLTLASVLNWLRNSLLNTYYLILFLHNLFHSVNV